MIHSCVHTHTTFCDGKNTMAELAEHALKCGLKTLGFSGHSYVAIDGFGMEPSKSDGYLMEAKRLKEEYRGLLDILCGIELDSFSENPEEYKSFDYIIASAHALFDSNGVYHVVDGATERFAQAASVGFDGDFYSLCDAYFKQFSDFIKRIRPQIVGHFDLVTKYNEKFGFFDVNNKRYIHSALTALDIALETDAVIEVNTGAVGRGYRTSPYPADFLLNRILERKGRVIITTDTHKIDKMLCWVDETEELLKSIGFDSVCELGVNGFYERKL